MRDAYERARRHEQELEDANRALREVLATSGARPTTDTLGPSVTPPDSEMGAPVSRLVDIARIANATLGVEPFAWGTIDQLYRDEDAAALAGTYPVEPFKTVVGDDGEKGYAYEVRALVALGASAPWRPDLLSPAWFELATDLCSPAYRHALAACTGCVLDGLAMEANLFHYGPGSWQGPHLDLADKVVTHVLYFNEGWGLDDGGCLQVLSSGFAEDVVAEVVPEIGSSVVLVRSDRSWHAVAPVAPTCTTTRRAVTVTFYRPGSISTMWPVDDQPGRHRFPPA